MRRVLGTQHVVVDRRLLQRNLWHVRYPSVETYKHLVWKLRAACMKVNDELNAEPAPRRTQAERTAATRALLVGAARKLFADKGFADVSTEAIVKAAGVTRGALYHQFNDKAGLFAAVYEDVERDLVADIAKQIMV